MALHRRICQTAASLSVLPAAESYGLPASKRELQLTTTSLGDGAFAAAGQQL